MMFYILNPVINKAKGGLKNAAKDVGFNTPA